MTIKSKNILMLMVVVITLVLVIALAYNYRYKNNYVLNLPKIEDIAGINISNDKDTKNYKTQSDCKEILNIILGLKRVTTNQSVQDVPVNIDISIKIDINSINSEVSTIFIYEKNHKYYIEQPYNGIYEISADEYNSINDYLNNPSISINNYYKNQITEKYKHINEIKADYTIEDAITDNCFVVNHAKVYNENLYEEFMNNYKDKKSGFIRLVNPTTEGDILIHDIKYDDQINKIIVIKYNTRDKFSSQEDRNITIKEYDKIDSYKYKNNLYWVAYTGELNDETFSSQNVLILATIN